MIALIDGDVLLYRFGFRGQTEFDWGNGLTSVAVNADETKEELDKFIKELIKKASCNQLLVCLSGPKETMFRYSLLPSYKHNRKDAKKPILFQELKDYLKQKYRIVTRPNLEADDCMGILATKRPGKYVICTIDKDLQQIPGRFFNWDKMEEPKNISQKQANKWFYLQILSGDPVDGFSGVPGVGKKRAKAFIDALYESGTPSEGEIWKQIVDVYAKKGLDERYALTQARMARILRVEDWDEKAQKPILWTPTK